MGVEVEGRVGRGSLAVCEEVVSNSGRRSDVESTWGQACGRAQGGGTRVLVAHVAFAGMLDLFYLRVVTKIQNILCGFLSPALKFTERLLFADILSGTAVVGSFLKINQQHSQKVPVP